MIKTVYISMYNLSQSILNVTTKYRNCYCVKRYVATFHRQSTRTMRYKVCEYKCHFEE